MKTGRRENRTGQGRRWIDLREAGKVLMEALLQTTPRRGMNMDALLKGSRSALLLGAVLRDLRYLLELRLRSFAMGWEGTESIF